MRTESGLRESERQEEVEALILAEHESKVASLDVSSTSFLGRR